ncbi:MAG: di- and tricarboxylate transporter [Candidatus Hydrogenedentota bacterium]
MNSSQSKVRRAGLWAGLAALLVIFFMPTPEGMSAEGQRVAAVALLMGVWWITEAIPIPATSLLPLALFPLLGVMSGKDLAVSYGDPNIFLFAGGFFIAMAMQKWRLHERMALNIVARTGGDPANLVMGFMVATAFLSLWISNAATTMMMVPIGLAVIDEVAGKAGKERTVNFGLCIMLGIAYAASIGGTGTLVGTPPNIVLAGTLARIYPEAPRIGFGQWMFFGIPFVLVFIPIAWFLLTRVLCPLRELGSLTDGEGAVRERLRALGPMSRGERIVLAVSTLTALAWIFRADLQLGAFTLPGWSRLLPHAGFVNDGTVAIFFAVLLFMIPVDRKAGEFALDWDWAVRIPWGVLLLFGGGFALAQGFSDTGLVEWAGNHLSVLSGFPLLVILIILCVAVTFLTEFTSNTALATIMLPILAVTATQGLHVHPLVLLVPATLSASMAFMMPVATPPNALVFGSGHVTVSQMARTGFVLNLVGVVLVVLITYLVVIPVLNITPGVLPAWAQ